MLGKVSLLQENLLITQQTSTATDQLLSLHTLLRPWSGWSSSIYTLWWVFLWIHSSLHFNLASEWTTPSSFNWTDHFLTWRSLEALWGSCSLISATCTFGGQTGACRDGPTLHVLDPWLPHQLATVCEDSGLCVGHSYLQAPQAPFTTCNSLAALNFLPVQTLNPRCPYFRVPGVSQFTGGHHQPDFSIWVNQASRATAWFLDVELSCWGNWAYWGLVVAKFLVSCWITQGIVKLRSPAEHLRWPVHTGQFSCKQVGNEGCSILVSFLHSSAPFCSPNHHKLFPKDFSASGWCLSSLATL